MESASHTRRDVRYEPDDRPSLLLTTGLGLQYAMLSIAEMPLRLLRHYAASVRHQQYHDTDVVTVRVEAATTA